MEQKNKLKILIFLLDEGKKLDKIVFVLMIFHLLLITLFSQFNRLSLLFYVIGLLCFIPYLYYSLRVSFDRAILDLLLDDHANCQLTELDRILAELKLKKGSETSPTLNNRLLQISKLFYKQIGWLLIIIILSGLTMFQFVMASGYEL